MSILNRRDNKSVEAQQRKPGQEHQVMIRPASKTSFWFAVEARLFGGSWFGGAGEGNYTAVLDA
ncbi:hypothetical protein ASD54_22820 [Rhizobium sp. Root149]|nr:hypothetical protein ASD54_22820 [Rhizobium sp. Root149]